jgi:hypothetical protein
VGQDGDVPNKDGLRVESTEGARWELALALIASGEAAVHMRAVTIWRDTAGPRATGLVRFTIETDENTPEDTVGALLDELREHVTQFGASDARLDRLLSEYGYSCEVVANYGMGTGSLAGPIVEPQHG